MLLLLAGAGTQLLVPRPAALLLLGSSISQAPYIRAAICGTAIVPYLASTIIAVPPLLSELIVASNCCSTRERLGFILFLKNLIVSLVSYSNDIKKVSR